MSDRFRHLELRESEQEHTPRAQVSGHPTGTARGNLEMADLSSRSGEFERALQLYTRALGQDRSLVPAWVGQVQMLVELDELAEARLWSDKALELFRNNGELLAAKARACARLGDHRAAVACSDASLQSPGSSPARWQARGEVMLARSTARAKDCFEKSLAEPGADWFDRVLIARIHLWHDRATAALEHAQVAVGLKPSHAYCWLVVGRCQEALGWCDMAAASYERCLELQPGHAEAATGLHAVRTRTLVNRVKGWLKGRLQR